MKKNILYLLLLASTLLSFMPKDVMVVYYGHNRAHDFELSEIKNITYSNFGMDGKEHDMPVSVRIECKDNNTWLFGLNNVDSIVHVHIDDPVIDPEEPQPPVDPEEPEEPETANFVDLGLSVKWATCNVGADKPEDFGKFYAWGETQTKSNYDVDTYKWYSNDTYTKYDEAGDVLESADDAATAVLGADWRIPTKAEMKELVDKCKWTWTEVNGVSGYEVAGTNGNTIFMPACGFMYGTALKDASKAGYYMTSTGAGDGNFEALTFYSTYKIPTTLFVECGYAVRAVCK